MQAARQPQGEDEPPDWLHVFRAEQWIRPDQRRVPADYDTNDWDRWVWRMIQARKRWKDARADWLREHGQPMPFGLTGYGKGAERATRKAGS